MARKKIVLLWIVLVAIQGGHASLFGAVGSEASKIFGNTDDYGSDKSNGPNKLPIAGINAIHETGENEKGGGKIKNPALNIFGDDISKKTPPLGPLAIKQTLTNLPLISPKHTNKQNSMSPKITSKPIKPIPTYARRTSDSNAKAIVRQGADIPKVASKGYKTVGINLLNSNVEEIPAELLKTLKPLLDIDFSSNEEQKLILNVKPPQGSNTSFVGIFMKDLKSVTTQILPYSAIGAKATIFKKKNGDLLSLRVMVYLKQISKPTSNALLHTKLVNSTKSTRNRINPTQTKQTSIKSESSGKPATVESAEINLAQPGMNYTRVIEQILQKLLENSTELEGNATAILLHLKLSLNASSELIKDLEIDVKSIVHQILPNANYVVKSSFSKQNGKPSIEFEILIKPKNSSRKIGLKPLNLSKAGVNRYHEIQNKLEHVVKSLTKKEPEKQNVLTFNLTLILPGNETRTSMREIFRTIKTLLRKLVPYNRILIEAQTTSHDGLTVLDLDITLKPLERRTSKKERLEDIPIDLTVPGSTITEEVKKLLPNLLLKIKRSSTPITFEFNITIPHNANNDSVRSEICSLITILTENIGENRGSVADIIMHMTIIPELLAKNEAKGSIGKVGKSLVTEQQTENPETSPSSEKIPKSTSVINTVEKSYKYISEPRRIYNKEMINRDYTTESNEVTSGAPSKPFVSTEESNLNAIVKVSPNSFISSISVSEAPSNGHIFENTISATQISSEKLPTFQKSTDIHSTHPIQPQPTSKVQENKLLKYKEYTQTKNRNSFPRNRMLSSNEPPHITSATENEEKHFVTAVPILMSMKEVDYVPTTEAIITTPYEIQSTKKITTSNNLKLTSFKKTIKKPVAIVMEKTTETNSNILQNQKESFKGTSTTQVYSTSTIQNEQEATVQNIPHTYSTENSLSSKTRITTTTEQKGVVSDIETDVENVVSSVAKGIPNLFSGMKQNKSNQETAVPQALSQLSYQEQLLTTLSPNWSKPKRTTESSKNRETSPAYHTAYSHSYPPHEQKESSESNTATTEYTASTIRSEQESTVQKVSYSYSTEHSISSETSIASTTEEKGLLSDVAANVKGVVSNISKGISNIFRGTKRNKNIHDSTVPQGSSQLNYQGHLLTNVRPSWSKPIRATESSKYRETTPVYHTSNSYTHSYTLQQQKESSESNSETTEYTTSRIQSEQKSTVHKVPHVYPTEHTLSSETHIASTTERKGLLSDFEANVEDVVSKISKGISNLFKGTKRNKNIHGSTVPQGSLPVDYQRYLFPNVSPSWSKPNRATKSSINYETTPEYHISNAYTTSNSWPKFERNFSGQKFETSTDNLSSEFMDWMKQISLAKQYRKNHSKRGISKIITHSSSTPNNSPNLSVEDLSTEANSYYPSLPEWNGKLGRALNMNSNGIKGRISPRLMSWPRIFREHLENENTSVAPNAFSPSGPYSSENDLGLFSTSVMRQHIPHVELNSPSLKWIRNSGGIKGRLFQSHTTAVPIAINEMTTEFEESESHSKYYSYNTNSGVFVTTAKPSQKLKISKNESLKLRNPKAKAIHKKTNAASSKQENNLAPADLNQRKANLLLANWGSRKSASSNVLSHPNKRNLKTSKINSFSQGIPYSTWLEEEDTSSSPLFSTNETHSATLVQSQNSNERVNSTLVVEKLKSLAVNGKVVTEETTFPETEEESDLGYTEVSVNLSRSKSNLGEKISREILMHLKTLPSSKCRPAKMKLIIIPPRGMTVISLRNTTESTMKMLISKLPNDEIKIESKARENYMGEIVSVEMKITIETRNTNNENIGVKNFNDQSETSFDVPKGDLQSVRSLSEVLTNLVEDLEKASNKDVKLEIALEPVSRDSSNKLEKSEGIVKGFQQRRRISEAKTPLEKVTDLILED